ncbi:BatD family protein [Cerasicoccus arenae]|uniref:Protein BatD n=1 Tax=Cerasicoccus arenae TaxID=424488 RepID=A0A8J3DI60_9BACT|nr:BatD family protein [Cerasicoccus arenae]MBK1858581.1 protein BatD [Cerasicoccus arenae]GHC05177.1 hypothetical protein GCM10007047_22710 [Cerasicoccus arenae]
MNNRFFNPIFIFIVFSLCHLAHAQDYSATSDFQPNIIREGERSRYQFTISSSSGNFQLDSVEMPQIDGLDFQYAGNSSSQEMSVTNQGFSRTLRQIYGFQVTGQKEGEYTMPLFHVIIDGKKIEVPSATLKVIKPTDNPTTGNEKSMWTELELPRESLYVGEAVLAKLKLIYDPNQIIDVGQARNPPFSVKEGDAFAIGQFGNQQSQDIEHEGRILREVSWQVMLTPLKTGPQPMVIQMDLVVAMKGNQQQRRSRHSLMDQLMGNRYERQQVTLYTEDRNIEVQPLPEENRPTYFTGGIGLFTVDKPKLSQRSAKAGEPLTMTLVVRGQGNFDRLQAPSLEQSDNWRDYPPEEQYFPADALGYVGYKTFEYTLIPREAGELKTPEINFNFFDPETAKYVELPIPGQLIPVAENPNAQSPKRNPVTARRGPELLSIASTPGQWVSAIRPVITDPIFLGGQAIPAILLGLMIFHRRRELRLQNDAAYARNIRADKHTRIELAAARQAASAADAQAFFAAAQRTVQAAAGRTVEQAPESLTVIDIEAIARRQGLSDEDVQNAREFIESGDAIRFGGLSQSKIDFSSELSRLEKTVNALGGSK